MSNYNVYLGDLHIHSNYSDGKDSVKDIVLAARNVGFDFIAIADHNEIEGSIHGAMLAEESGLGIKVFPAEEVTAPWGHLLALGISKLVSPEGEPGDICKAVHDQQGFVFASHPYWIDTRETFWDKGIFDDLLHHHEIDGFELINTGAVPPYDNMPVIQKYYDMRMKNIFHPFIGSSDAHDKDAIGRDIKMYVLAESLTRKHVMEAILDGRCIIEWQKRYYGDDKYFSDIDMWFRTEFIDHLQQCREEVARQ